MHEIIKYRGRIGVIWIIVLILLFMAFTGCKARDRIFTIGIASHVAIDDSILKGFKQGMAELGYVEDKNIKYIYNGAIGRNNQIIDAEIRELLAQDIDLLLTAYNEASLRAKKAVEGTDTPVLAIACARPVEIGLVKSLSHPGGNMTGVQVTETMSKGLEWLVQVAPHAKKIYLPYNPDDEVSVLYLDVADKTASQLGIELVIHEVRSIEEAVAAIEGLPKNVDAIYGIPSPTLGPRAGELSQAAIKRGLPLGAGLPMDEAVLITFATDIVEMGRQAARLARQIHQGTKPADLPLETSEDFLTINLKTAEKIGLHIPDDVLAQATTIIR